MEDASEWNEDVTMHSAEAVPEAAPATDGAGVADTAEAAAAGDDAEDDGFVRQLDEEWAEYRAEDGTLYYYNKVTDESRWEIPEQHAEASAAEPAEATSDAAAPAEAAADTAAAPVNTTTDTTTATPAPAPAPAPAPEQSEGDFETGAGEAVPDDAWADGGRRKRGRGEDGYYDEDDDEDDDDDDGGGGVGDDEDVQRAKRDAQRQAAEENAETKLQRQRDRKRRRQELLSRVKDDDYVVDPHVLECVHSLLDISAAPDAEEEPITQQDTARMLTDGFKGYGRMYRLLQGWMAEVCAPMAGESPTSRPAEVGAAVAESMRNTVVNALSGSLQEWYTPKQAAKLFDSESKEELKALQEMLVDPDWRRAIVRLADRHRGCPVLSFCLKTITRQGHLDEVFAVSSASNTFSVCDVVLRARLWRSVKQATGMFSRLPCDNLLRELPDFTRFFGHSAYSYLFAHEVLRKLSTSPPAAAVAAAASGGAGAGAGAGAEAAASASASASAAASSSSTTSTSPPAGLFANVCKRLQQELEIAVLATDHPLRKQLSKVILAQELQGVPSRTLSVIEDITAKGRELGVHWRRITRERCTRRQRGSTPSSASSAGGASLSSLLQPSSSAHGIGDSLGVSGLGDSASSASGWPQPPVGLSSSVGESAIEVLLKGCTPAAGSSDTHGVVPLHQLRTPTMLAALVAELFHPFRRIKDRHRKRTAQVLAYAVSGSADKVWKGDSLVTSTMEKLEEVSEICNEESTLNNTILPSTETSLTQGCAAFPVVAEGVLFWIHSALTSPSFTNGPLFAECAQTLLSFVRRIVKQYPLLRPRALDVLRVAFVVDQTEETDFRALISLRVLVLDAMVEMMPYGFGLEVLDFVYSFADKMDKSLLRHFVEVMLCVTASPYMPTFAASLLRLLALPCTSSALQSSRQMTRRQVKELVAFCKSIADKLAAEGATSELNTVAAWPMAQ